MKIETNLTIKTYDKIAKRYSKSNKRLMPNDTYKKFLSLVPKKSKILEAGCGYGRDCEVFAKSGCDVVGIDLSQGMLDVAKGNASGVKFIQMSVCDLDFPDKFFDGIWCNSVLLHLSKKQCKKAMTELSRVLKSGGILYVSVRKGEDKELVREGPEDSPRYFTYFSEAEMEEYIKKSGFAIIEKDFFNKRKVFGPEWEDVDIIGYFCREEVKSWI